MSKTKGHKELEAAGFTVVKAIRLKFRRPGKWFEVITPDNDKGCVLRIGSRCWHFFYKDIGATSSGSSVESCPNGMLGDAVGTDAELETYKKNVISSPVRLKEEYEGLYAAVGQVIFD